MREEEREFARREMLPADEPYFVQITTPVQIDEYTVLQPGTVVRLFGSQSGDGITIGHDGAMYDVSAAQTDLRERSLAAAAAEASELSD